MAHHTSFVNHEILEAKRGKDFTLHGSDGLFLLVKASVKKIWCFRYQRSHGNKNPQSLAMFGKVSPTTLKEYGLTITSAGQIRVCTPTRP